MAYRNADAARSSAYLVVRDTRVLFFNNALTARCPRDPFLSSRRKIDHEEYLQSTTAVSVYDERIDLKELTQPLLAGRRHVVPKRSRCAARGTHFYGLGAFLALRLVSPSYNGHRT